MSEDLLKTGQTRIFTIEDGASPARSPEYQGRARADTASWAQGTVTPIRLPSRSTYTAFDDVDEVITDRGRPELQVIFRSRLDYSEMLKIVRKGCPLDIQVHAGDCEQPTDFNSFQFVRILEDARPTNWSTGAMGALDSAESAAVDETVPFSGRDLYDVKRIAPAAIAGSEVVQEIVAVAICDSKSCGACGVASDGTQRFFGLTLSAGGSPGLAAEVIYTEDGGTTFGDTNVTTLAANEDPDDMTCVGTRLVVVSEDSLSLHHALINDILDGTETWAEVTTGFVAAKGPRAIFSLGATKTWIVGAAGYVYFTDDVTSDVEVQDAGVATVQNLNDVHGVDEQNLVAVGASNVVLLTTNGGDTWSLKTGPAVGVALNCVWMKSKTEWLVGTANGKLYYTTDSGDTWTEKTFSGSGAGQVREISFATKSVGYMAHDTATPVGRIFRTIDGGNSWYALPEDSGISMVAVDRFNALAATSDDPNFVVAGGLNDDASDGVMVKLS